MISSQGPYFVDKSTEDIINEAEKLIKFSHLADDYKRQYSLSKVFGIIDEFNSVIMAKPRSNKVLEQPV